MIGGLAHALANNPLSEALRTHGWIWPAIETFHLLGMIFVFGTLVIVDLRILGFAPDMPLGLTSGLLTLAIAGFALNLITGSLLVMGDASHFLSNPAFWTKMVLISAAILNAGLFTMFVRNGPAERITSRPARIAAAFSLVLWSSVIVLARFIAYVEDVR